MILQNLLFYKAFLILFNIKEGPKSISIAKVDFGAIFKMTASKNIIYLIISPKFENFGDIMVLVAPPPPSPPPSPPPHANACTGHNFVTNTPIKFIFAIAIEVPDYKNPMIFVINRKNKMSSGGHFV